MCTNGFYQFEFGTSGAGTFIDFHTSPTTYNDYDSRIIATGGTNTTGQGNIIIKAQNVSVSENFTVGAQMRGVWQVIREVIQIQNLQNYSFSNNFRELKIILRRFSTSGTAGTANIRLAFKSGATDVTHTGVTIAIFTSNVQNPWNSAYMILGNPVVSELIDYVIRIHYMGILNGSYSYVVDGIGYNTYPYTYTLSGHLDHTSPIDNISFTLSTGTFDNGRVSIYATYF